MIGPAFCSLLVSFSVPGGEESRSGDEISGHRSRRGLHYRGKLFLVFRRICL